MQVSMRLNLEKFSIWIICLQMPLYIKESS